MYLFFFILYKNNIGTKRVNVNILHCIGSALVACMTFYCSVGYRKPFYFERRYLVTYSYLFTYLYQEQGQFFFSSTSALSFICTYFTTQNQNKIQFYLCWRVAKFKQLISAFVKVLCLIFGTWPCFDYLKVIIY